MKNVCSLQSGASERLQSLEKLIHELLSVLTACRAAREDILSMSITPMTLSPSRQQARTVITQREHIHMQPSAMRCPSEDVCPACEFPSYMYPTEWRVITFVCMCECCACWGSAEGGRASRQRKPRDKRVVAVETSGWELGSRTIEGREGAIDGERWREKRGCDDKYEGNVP